TGGREACFLNSEADYKDAKNFAVFISEAALVKFKEAKIENPKEFYKGKLVRVTGMVVLYRDKPEIKVDSPDQIALVEKKGPALAYCSPTAPIKRQRGAVASPSRRVLSVRRPPGRSIHPSGPGSGPAARLDWTGRSTWCCHCPSPSRRGSTATDRAGPPAALSRRTAGPRRLFRT